MKVIVTASGRTADSPVDPRFGRAPHFIVVDTASGVVEAVDNADGVSAGQGAGVQAAQRVAGVGAECLITGHCGPKAFRALDAAGIAVYTGATGSVAHALEMLAAGQLKRAGGPDVGGHWM